jgi:hypothetical protein
MRTLKFWFLLVAATIFASIVIQFGFISWVPTRGARGNAADSTRIAKIKKREARALMPEEKQRDYAVIEAALIDLTDPKSPVNENAVRNGHVGTYIVFGPRSSEYVSCLSRETLPSLVDDKEGRTIQDEIGDDLRRRNPGAPASLEDFHTDKAPVRMRDVYSELEGAFGWDFDEKDGKLYQNS